MEPSAFAVTRDGEGAWYLWFRVCDNPRCECRDALVLATREGRDLLEPYTRRVEEAWRAGHGRERVAGLAGGPLVTVTIDIDTGAPVEDSAAGEAIAATLDGELLDAMHARWTASKGRPVAGGPTPPDALFTQTWRFGDMVAWHEAFPLARHDLFVDDDGVWEADEQYCVTPGCKCSVVVVSCVDSDTGEYLGSVDVDYASEAPVSARDEDWWRVYTRRHPGWRARLRARHAKMRPFGVLLLAAQSRLPAKPAKVLPTRKVGRNEACPCGSGRKYKRCCGAA